MFLPSIFLRLCRTWILSPSLQVLLTSSGTAKLADVGVSRLQTRTFLSDLPGMIGTFAWFVGPPALCYTDGGLYFLQRGAFLGTMSWKGVVSGLPAGPLSAGAGVKLQVLATHLHAAGLLPQGGARDPHEPAQHPGRGHLLFWRAPVGDHHKSV